MENERWEALRRATDLVAEVQEASGVAGVAEVEWFHVDADFATTSPFRVDQNAKTVGLNRAIVAEWFARLARTQADERCAALALRAGAELLFGPPAHEWSEAAELHIRSEQDKGLDETYASAFRAANNILESHRLDQRVLDLLPDAGDRLAELVRYELEAHPAFDLYPRAAIIVGRPNLPKDLARPAFDEFVDEFGVDEADDLANTLGEYVALLPDAIDDMVDATAQLVFQAFPEAMGLAVGDPAASDVWPLQAELPADGTIGWRTWSSSSRWRWPTSTGRLDLISAMPC